MMPDEAAIYLIDGTAYVHRAYHAVRGLTNSKGLPTNAVFGFTRMLLKLFEERVPQHAAMFFDAKGPTFRHERYAAYKANRPPMPEDMAVQLPFIRDVCKALRIPLFEMAGYEADDLIGTVARQAERDGHAVVMVTGDKDFIQLVSESTTMWDPMKEKAYDAAAVRAEYGVAPAQFVDALGLAGDTADNVPGVPGIGMKTALALIHQFGDMDRLYVELDAIKKRKQKSNLVAYREQAFLSRELVTIRTDAPIRFDFDELALGAPDQDKLTELFKELEFRQLQKAFQVEAAGTPKRYQAVQTVEDLAALRSRLEAAELLAVDTETTSQDPMRAAIVGISFATQPHEAFYVPCGHDSLAGAGPQLSWEQIRGALRPVLENQDKPKVGQNIKYDWIVLHRHGVALAGVVFDTMLASYLLNPSKRAHNLDQIALDYLGHKTISYQDVAGKGARAVSFAQVPLNKATPYACEDADITLLAKLTLEQELERWALDRLMQEVEVPLIPVLMRMEMQGICVDRGRLRSLSRHFSDRLASLEEEIYTLAGERFNVNSSRQLGTILFEKLGLPVQKKTRKKTAYSTDVRVLTRLAEEHELPALILQHRSLAKLKSTYADALIGLIHPETGRIHTSFNQTVTATGRLSSSGPNLQNIPVRTEEGRKIRQAFVPRKGWVLVSADYSQIELRLLAHCSEDAILIEAFARDEDIHTRTAAEVFGLRTPEVTAELRRQAKAINFGIIYGMSPYGLAQQLGIGQVMAKAYIDHYFDRHRGVKRFMQETVAAARRNRHTSTLLGRIRRLPDIDSSNHNVRQFAERTAINTPIQGSAADLIKLAMIRTDAALQRSGLQAVMLLSVHDELLFEAPVEEQPALRELLEDVMTGIWKLKVPLRVNFASGSNWAEAH